jgi:AraC family transcriptional regulator
MKAIPKKKSLNVSLILEDEFLKISLAVPVSSRQRAKWNNIKARYYHQPSDWPPASLTEKNIIKVPIRSSKILDVLADDALYQNGNIYSSLSRQSQKTLWEETIKFIHLYLDPTAKSSEGNLTQFSLNLEANDPLIQGLALDLLSELKSRGWDCCLSMWGEWATLGFHLIRQTAAGQVSPKGRVVPALRRDMMKNIVDYIHSHLEQDLSLAKLAFIAKISLYHFARQFKKSVGAPPHRYVTQCRIEKAKQLLADKDLSITEITHQIGLQSQSHFTSLFHQSVGLTPSAYRNQL